MAVLQKNSNTDLGHIDFSAPPELPNKRAQEAEKLLKNIAQLDIDNLTPLEALSLLSDIKKKAVEKWVKFGIKRADRQQDCCRRGCRTPGFYRQGAGGKLSGCKATAITVSILDGGIREIRVTDNGEGISSEDMPLTILKHATSKIYTLQDLERIYSMGFRGEALASIAAVSMLTIKSRVPESDAGTELFAKGGKVEYIREAGTPEGTSVVVENLFYNTPAR